MPLNTDYSVPPYFDDYDETKNYHRILFNPHLAVQARELTQLQTILQNQIERFGDNILKEGTIVQGGNFVEDTRLQYVKLQDFDASGSSISPTDYVGKILVGTTTGLRAQVVSAQDGFESQAPHLNTVWVKYLDTALASDGVTESKVFADGENLNVYEVGGVSILSTPVAAATEATGRGYGVWCGDGIIFHKGFFIRFENALTIVSKYSRFPHEVVVGFETIEEIVSYTEDTSLLDNANSFNNFNAPGADRLKLTPVLVTKTLAEAAADEHFFALQEYQNGMVVRRKLETVYNKLGNNMAKRTYEESGNYVVRGFDVGVEKSEYDGYLDLTVGAGIGYIEGYRVELSDTFKLITPQGTATATENNQNILINYGNYIVVDNMSGWFDFDQIDSVDLTDAGGNVIGTTRIRSVTNHNIPGQHRIYVFDTQMTSGSFVNVRSIVNGVDGSADVVLDALGNAVIKDGAFKKMIYYSGKNSIKSYDANFTEYTYRAVQDTQVALTGTMVISVAGNDEFPYGAGVALSPDQIRDLIVVVTNDNGDTNYNTKDIIDLTGATAAVDGTGKTLTITLATPPAVTPMDVKVYYNVYRTIAQPIGKVSTDFTVTIETASHPNGFTGAWCLGVPDAYEITSVIQNGVNDLTNKFRLDAGQRDTHYGLSYLANNGASLVNGDVLVVNFKAFTKQTSGSFNQSFFSVESYQDVSPEYIPVYVTESGAKMSLRDCIDFRPYVSQTFSGTTATNPSNTETFPSAPLYLAAPNSYVNATYDYYLGRYDAVVVDRDGRFSVVSGVPSENPVKPVISRNSMILGMYYIPPYPSLTSTDAFAVGNTNYAVRFTKQDNRRYTMEDIRAIDTRIKNLEYYTALSLIEQDTKDLVVQDEFGNNRFKNGIFIDSFKDFRIADLNNPEFSAGLDMTEAVVHPKFETVIVNFKLSRVTDVTDHGETVTLPYFERVAIDQPYATSAKSLTTGYYNFIGEMFITPDTDTAPDVTNAPDVNPDVDDEDSFVDPKEDLADTVKCQRPSRGDKKRDRKSWWKNREDDQESESIATMRPPYKKLPWR